MSAADRSEPVRSCIGCRQRRPQSALVRVTASSAGMVVGGASDGRGAWLCRSARSAEHVDRSCLETALARRAFSRAWRVDHGAIDDDAIRAGFTGGDESDAQ